MVGITAPADRVQFRRHGDSLAMYRRIADLQNFWEDHWGERPIADVLNEARSGRLGELEHSITGFLPVDGTILEAGCGTGRVVQAMTARGYEVIGVDYAAGTLAEVCAASPELQVEVGDITALRWNNDSFAGYVSIGVMEHMYDGPTKAMSEALRVLRPGGLALISVPYKNGPRQRLWRRVEDAQSEMLPGEWRFYQDHVSVEGFASLLADAGFDIVDVHPYGLYGAMLRDLRILAFADTRGLLRYRVRKALKAACLRAPRLFRNRYSHMMMFVCRKPEVDTQ